MYTILKGPDREFEALPVTVEYTSEVKHSFQLEDSQRVGDGYLNRSGIRKGPPVVTVSTMIPVALAEPAYRG